jgi:DNA invertase Pin-like site-specific DNA recombinase
VAFCSLTEHMDTTTPQGAFLYSVFGALAQYERVLTQERIRARLEATRRRGKRGGRAPGDQPRTTGGHPRPLDVGTSKASLCRTFGVKRTTLYDALARAAAQTVPLVQGGA